MQPDNEKFQYALQESIKKYKNDPTYSQVFSAIKKALYIHKENREPMCQNHYDLHSNLETFIEKSLQDIRSKSNGK